MQYNARIQEFLTGGGGLDNLFLASTYFFTVYRGGPKVLLRRKLYFSEDPEGIQHFPGVGVPTFSRGGGGGFKCYRNPNNL